MNINIESFIIILRTRGRVQQSEVRRLNTTIVERPIERHKSGLASRETGDGLTGTYSGGSLDRTELLYVKESIIIVIVSYLVRFLFQNQYFYQLILVQEGML